MATMKAIRFHSFGGPEVLVYEEIDRPSLQEGEVIVRVEAAGVNPGDSLTRANTLGNQKPEMLPMIPGWDVSGIVEEVASDGTEFQAGDAVYGMIRFPQPGRAYAEYTAAPAIHLAHKPGSLEHTQAAAVPLVGLTAWQILFEKAELKAGQTVFINGAAGGVGHLAVQFSKNAGARVIGTASATKLDFLQKLGVDQPIDYRATPFETVASEVDVFFDTVGDAAERAIEVIKPGGVFVSVVPFFPPSEKATAKGIRRQGHLVYPNAAQLVEIGRLIDEGKVRPTVQTVLPLAQARQAHELIENRRTTGKIVLKVN